MSIMTNLPAVVDFENAGDGAEIHDEVPNNDILIGN